MTFRDAETIRAARKRKQQAQAAKLKAIRAMMGPKVMGRRRKPGPVRFGEPLEPVVDEVLDAPDSHMLHSDRFGLPEPGDEDEER